MTAIATVVGAALLVVGLSTHAAPFNAATAPDPISRDVLTHALTRVDEGTPRGVDSSPTIHRNFPQIIEQNFARLDAREMGVLVDALSEAELSDLAQLYVNATTDGGLPPKLYFVMAHRLDASRLGRVSKHFGFAPVYTAVTAMAPSKTQDFLAQTHTAYEGPTPGERRFGPAGRFAPKPSAGFVHARYRVPNESWRMGLRKVGVGQFLNMTPYEVYLDFRTAPVGALAVTGALWETAVVLSYTMTVAYSTGAAIGTYVVAPLVEAYAPSLYNAIGGTISVLVDQLTQSWTGGTSAAGSAQQSTAPVFQSTSMQITDFGNFGGDYGAAQAWSDYLAAQGGTCFGTRCISQY